MTAQDIRESALVILEYCKQPPSRGELSEQIEFLRSLGIYMAQLAEMQASVAGLIAQAKGAATGAYTREEVKDLGWNFIKAQIESATAHLTELEVLLDRTRAAIEHGGEWTRSILAAQRSEARLTPDAKW